MSGWKRRWVSWSRSASNWRRPSVIFSAYGPGDHPWSLVSDCVRTCLADGEMRLGSCDQMWNFLYIEDLAEAVVRLALCEEPLMADGAGGDVYNLAGVPEDTRVLREFDYTRIFTGMKQRFA